MNYVALSLSACLIAGCTSATEELATEAEAAAQIEPYLRYFESIRIEGVYLFADLGTKARFDRAVDDDLGLDFKEFVTRAGQLVYIHSPPLDSPAAADVDVEDGAPTRPVDPALRMARAYELDRDTELFVIGEPDTPDIDRPPEDDSDAGAS
jgi:hypothetical protein